MSHTVFGSQTRLCLATAWLLATLAPVGAQAQAGGAKDLFFGEQHPTLVAEKRIQPTTAGAADTAKPQPAAATTTATTTAATKTPPAAAKPSHPGLRVWLTDASDASGTKRLSPQHTFRTGDRVRLSVQSNRDGYLYVLNVGTSGETRLLFPRANGDNRVQRFKDFSFSSPLVFNEPAGTEQLVLVLAAAPTDNVSVQMQNGGMQRVTLRGSGSLAPTKTGGAPAATPTQRTPAQPAPAAAPPRQVQTGAPGGSRDAAADTLDLALADLRGSKDLKFDDDGAELVAVANRSDERPGAAFAPVVVNLRLTHQR